MYRRGTGPRRRGCFDIRTYLLERGERPSKIRCRTDGQSTSSYVFDDNNGDEMIDPLTQTRGYVIRLSSVRNILNLVQI